MPWIRLELAFQSPCGKCWLDVYCKRHPVSDTIHATRDSKVSHAHEMEDILGMSKPKMPNSSLRYCRERRNWTQEQAAEALLALCGPGKRGEVNARMISKWERGVQIPSLEYRDKLCTLYDVQSPEELGFLKREEVDALDTFRRFPSSDSSSIPSHSHGEPQEEAWLTYGTSSLAQLFNSGWSMNDILTSVNIVLQGMSGMSSTTRQQLLVSDVGKSTIPSLNGKRVSEEELAQLHLALGESIGAGWKLFHTASNTMILALGQTQLSLVQQVHPLLYPSVRPYLYTGIYGLIGMALHFQERNIEALHMHQNGYFAASTTGNSWYIVASLISQADSYHALGQYNLAIRTLEEALYTVREPIDETLTGLKAHLLSCWADNAMMLENYRTAQEKLEASEEYLDQIVPNEEFDKASWLLLAGKYALKTENYKAALYNFESALVELPDQWTLRRTMTALGATKAYARMRERDKSLEVAENLIPMIRTINAKLINRWFSEYIQQDLLRIFPTDRGVRTFVTHTYQELPQLASS